MSAIATTNKIDLRTIKAPTKRQRKFIELWLSPDSDTFGNAYQSAILAGFSKSAARNITGNARNLEWISDAKTLLISNLSPEHIYAGLQNIATHSRADRDKLRALELMAKIQGMFIERSVNHTTVQFTNSVPRPLLDAATHPLKLKSKDTGYLDTP